MEIISHKERISKSIIILLKYLLPLSYLQIDLFLLQMLQNYRDTILIPISISHISKKSRYNCMALSPLYGRGEKKREIFGGMVGEVPTLEW